jgi:hypothetical protein
MLTALEQGVKGGVWFSLIDKVYAPANLFASYAKVAANRGAAGVDHVTVEDFTKQLSRKGEPNSIGSPYPYRLLAAERDASLAVQTVVLR